MRETHLWVLLALITLGTSEAGAPAAQQEFFSERNRLYQEGDYRGALDRYKRVLEAGYESGPLYYNIGNAYFKLGELGGAILNYERAKRIDPRNENVAANLELARSLTADEITPLPGFWVFRAVDWCVHLIPLSWLGLVVAIGYVSAMSGLVVAILGRGAGVSAWGRRLAVIGGLVAVVFAVNAAVVEFEFGKTETAVILADEVAVQSAPAEDRALQVFSIHEGTEVRIDRRADEWLEIVLADGKVGWVRSDVLEII